MKVGEHSLATPGRIYADTNLGGAFSLNQPISASGKFDYTEASAADFGPPLAIGHFLSVGDPLPGFLVKSELDLVVMSGTTYDGRCLSVLGLRLEVQH